MYIVACMSMTLFSLAALIALLPAVLHGLVPKPVDGEDPRDRRFWLVLAVALAGAAALAWGQVVRGWTGDLAAVLWVTIAVTLAMIAGLSALSATVARLLPLAAAYLFLLAILALARAAAGPVAGIQEHDTSPVLLLHIAVSALTYALFTLAAVAALGVILREQVLKRRVPSTLGQRLPSVAEGEELQRRLLAASAAILGLGLATGVVLSLAAGMDGEAGTRHLILPFTHKTLLSFFAFVVILGLLVIERISGVAGKRMARWLLLAYLALTLAYPGVRFVQQVLIG